MSGDDGLRDAIAEQLAGVYMWGAHVDPEFREQHRREADRLLALPEVAALRAKAAAADRVRELAEELRAEVRSLVDARVARGSYDDGLKVGLGFAHDRIRAALDGDGT